MAGTESTAARVAQLAVRYALTLPGGDVIGYDDPLGRLEAANGIAQLELDRVGPEVEDQRSAAAVRLATLPDANRVWGNTLTSTDHPSTTPARRAR
jgi:hypothetical protein